MTVTDDLLDMRVVEQVVGTSGRNAQRRQGRKPGNLGCNLKGANRRFKGVLVQVAEERCAGWAPGVEQSE